MGIVKCRNVNCEHQLDGQCTNKKLEINVEGVCMMVYEDAEEYEKEEEKKDVKE